MDSSTSADFVHHPGDADPARASTQTLGHKLRGAREAAGLSLGEVAERTRVPERMLVSIEAGAYEALPTPTFTAGFIRSFAREVGVNEAEVAAQYRAENTRVIAPPAPVSMRPIEPQRVPSRQLAWASAAMATLAVVGTVIYFATRNHAPVAVASTAPAPASASTSTAPVSDSTAPAPMPSTLPPTPSTPAISGTAAPAVAAGAVTLTAMQDAWIQVRERTTHTRVMSGVLAQGQTYAVPPGDYTLSTGRAGALQVKVGDRLLPPLGGPVDILHDLSLDAVSLAARGGSAPATRSAQAPTR